MNSFFVMFLQDQGPPIAIVGNAVRMHRIQYSFYKKSHKCVHFIGTANADSPYIYTNLFGPIRTTPIGVRLP